MPAASIFDDAVPFSHARWKSARSSLIPSPIPTFSRSPFKSRVLLSRVFFFMNAICQSSPTFFSTQFLFLTKSSSRSFFFHFNCNNSLGLFELTLIKRHTTWNIPRDMWDIIIIKHRQNSVSSLRSHAARYTTGKRLLMALVR